MKILLLCSSFNGLTQRVWIALRHAGYAVSWQTADDDTVVRATVAATEPDLILCPFLRERVPDDVWRSRPTVIIHPGPIGDRGPSSLDWAISDDEPEWGVTALSAIAEMDAGPVWATRAFPMPDDPPRKSELYAGPVTDAAVELALEVASRVAGLKAATSPPAHPVGGRPRPTMTQAAGPSPGPTPPRTSFGASAPPTGRRVSGPSSPAWPFRSSTPTRAPLHRAG